MLTGHSQTVDWRGNTEKLVIRTNDISPLDAVLLLNDDNVKRLFGEKRPAVDDLHTGDFCLRYVQRKQRKKAMMFGKGLTWLQPNLVIALLSTSLILSSTLMICECLGILICADVLRKFLVDVSLCRAWMV
jgi:hypothetical protein